MVLEEFDEKKLEELAKGLPEFGRFGKELETIGVFTNTIEAEEV